MHFNDLTYDSLFVSCDKKQIWRYSCQFSQKYHRRPQKFKRILVGWEDSKIKLENISLHQIMTVHCDVYASIYDAFLASNFSGRSDFPYKCTG